MIEVGSRIRPKPAGHVHLVRKVLPLTSGNALVVTACRKRWADAVVTPQDPVTPVTCERCQLVSRLEALRR